MSQEINIKEFKMTQIVDNAVVVFIGKRKTGKSFCLRDVMYHKQYIPVGMVMSKSERANKFFEKFIPKIFIHNKWNADKAAAFYNRAVTMAEKKSEDSKIDNRSFLILDDLMGNVHKWSKDETVKDMALLGRHYNVFFAITLQYPIGMPPNLRTNVDYIFLFRENSNANLEKLYKNWASMIPTYDLFKKLFKELTKNYGCMVIENNNSNASDWTEQVFWFKAKERSNFKCCDQRSWNFYKTKGMDINENRTVDKFDNKRGVIINRIGGGGDSEKEDN